MLVGIVNQKKNIFYIYMKKNQDRVAITIVLENDKKVRVLNEEEAKYLLNTIFSSKIEYNEEKDGYDIYIDEAGNQRFYKNGKEDYLMFFYNNGVSAIQNDAENSLNKNNLKDTTKRFKLVTGGMALGLILSVLPLEILQKQSTVENQGIEYVQDNYIVENTEQANTTFYLEECKGYIYNSEYLTEDEKELLYNEDLLKDVLAVADNSRNYDFRQRFSNIKIIKYEELDKNRNGYYDFLIPNEIYLANHLFSCEDKNKWKNILVHEIIHLLQAYNEYNYLREACAEIIKKEYYGLEISTYFNEVKNIEVLMELIGPEPIFECNFKNDTSELENEIGKYLEPEDADRLISLLKTHSNKWTLDLDMEKNLNDEIKILLEKIYNNLDDKTKPSKKMIEKIYNDESNGRVYFNQRKDEYNKDFVLEINEVSLPDKESNILYYKDGTIGKIKYCGEDLLLVQRYKVEEITEPSIKKKFGFQIDKNIKKEEINDKNDIER